MGYHINNINSYNNCYKINSVSDLAEIKIPADATGFCVFYRLTHTTLVNGKIFSFSYEQKDKAFDNFFVRADNNIKFQQLVRAVQQFKLPNVQLVDGKKGQIKARFVERHFISCNPELNSFEERELYSLKNFILPKSYEKAELIRVSQLLWTGKNALCARNLCTSKHIMLAQLKMLAKKPLVLPP